MQHGGAEGLSDRCVLPLSVCSRFGKIEQCALYKCEASADCPVMSYADQLTVLPIQEGT